MLFEVFPSESSDLKNVDLKVSVGRSRQNGLSEVSGSKQTNVASHGPMSQHEYPCRGPLSHAVSPRLHPRLVRHKRSSFHPAIRRTPLCRLCGRLEYLISEPTRAVGADGDRGDCTPYWSTENGRVATTQSADGCTLPKYQLSGLPESGIQAANLSWERHTFLPCVFSRHDPGLYWHILPLSSPCLMPSE